MGHYELSEAAALDFENIFDFGIDTFGLAQALEYQQGMTQRFLKVAEQPKLYPTVDDIRAGYRRSVYISHSIYYRIDPPPRFYCANFGAARPAEGVSNALKQFVYGVFATKKKPINVETDKTRTTF